jgi:multiple sugar transport system permease protein
MAVTSSSPSTTDTAAAPRRLRALTDRAVANLFLLPTILLLVAMNVFPLFWSLYLSFTRYKADAPKVAPVWLGNANYEAMLASDDVWKAFRTTAGFTLLAVLLQLVVGFGLALLLNRAFTLRGLITTLLLLPMMLSSVVVGLFWKFLLDPSSGLVNHALIKIGLCDPLNPINWFDQRHVLWSVVIADTWQWSPFVMLIALAGLSSVPTTLYEAASVDRASDWFKFRYITLPFIGPLLMVALLFRTLDSFKMFDLAWVMTKGGVANAAETVSIQVYRRAMEQYNTGDACALAYIVLLVIIGLTNLYLMLMSRVRGEGSADSVPLLSPESPPLALWNRVAPPALGLLLAVGAFRVGGPAMLGVLLVAVGIGALIFRLPQRIRTPLAYGTLAIALLLYLAPLVWIVMTSLKTYADVNTQTPVLAFTPTIANYAELWHPTSASAKAFFGQLVGSVIVGVTSTVLAVGLGTLAAYSFSRFRIKAKGDALFFILSTRMLPAVVVAVPVFLMFRTLDQTFSGIGLHFLNSLFGLVLLYTTVGVAFATWLMKGFTDDVPPEYEEAALLDRYTRLQAFRRTTLPLILPGMAATAVFCFLNAWNEYAFAQFLTTGGDALTAPPSIFAQLGAGTTEWNQIAARAVVFLIPAAFFTFVMRDYLLRGMTFGAIKGR